ncbi:MAG TPA: hypothetical protein VIK72_17560 [Clostridiaceae bacterium]
MNPIKPKYMDTVKADWKISKRSSQIIIQYAKYTKYDEDEIIDRLISDLITDKEFVKWLKGRRYQKKIQGTIFEDGVTEFDGITEVKEGDVDFEEIQEIGKFQ